MVSRMIASSGAMRSRMRGSSVACQQSFKAALRTQYEFGQLADRALAACRGRNPMRGSTHLRCRIGNRGCEAGPRKHRKIGPVVAHVSAVLLAYTRLAQDALETRYLICGALHHTLDAKLPGTPRDDLGLARGEDRDLDSALAQQLDAMAVPHMEGLHRFATRAVIEPPVGEHTVDIEDHQAHLCGARDCAHRILAAVRSCICNAPTRRPSSTTSNWLRSVLSSMRAASAASASGRIASGLRVMTSATRRLRTSPTRSSSRRRSPSVKMPAARPSSSTIAVMPIFFAVISCTASITLAPSGTLGIAFAVRMMSLTRIN